MVWEVHRPKLGRFHPSAPLISFFGFLPVQPSGLQGTRASLFLTESFDHSLHVHIHGAHFSITQGEMKQQQKLGNLPCHCREVTIRDTKITVSSGACLLGHSVKHSVHIPKQWWQKPTVYHQQQPLSSLRRWRNGTPEAAKAASYILTKDDIWPMPTALLQSFAAHKTRQITPCLTIRKLRNLAKTSGGKPRYFK